MPDKIKKLFFGMKSRAEQETERQRLIASEAQWRAEYNSKQVRAHAVRVTSELHVYWSVVHLNAWLAVLSALRCSAAV